MARQAYKAGSRHVRAGRKGVVRVAGMGWQAAWQASGVSTQAGWGWVRHLQQAGTGRVCSKGRKAKARWGGENVLKAASHPPSSSHPKGQLPAGEHGERQGDRRLRMG